MISYVSDHDDVCVYLALQFDGCIRKDITLIDCAVHSKASNYHLIAQNLVSAQIAWNRL